MTQRTFEFPPPDRYDTLHAFFIAALKEMDRFITAMEHITHADIIFGFWDDIDDEKRRFAATMTALRRKAEAGSLPIDSRSVAESRVWIRRAVGKLVRDRKRQAASRRELDKDPTPRSIRPSSSASSAQSRPRSFLGSWSAVLKVLR